MAEALEGVDASRVRGVGVSGQQHGLVALDKDCQVSLWHLHSWSQWRLLL